MLGESGAMMSATAEAEDETPVEGEPKVESLVNQGGPSLFDEPVKTKKKKKE